MQTDKEGIQNLNEHYYLTAAVQNIKRLIQRTSTAGSFGAVTLNMVDKLPEMVSESDDAL